MRNSIGRLSSSILQSLLPSANADACTTSYCQTSGSKRRCCKVCPNGVVACTPYITGSCKNYTCPN